MNPSRAPPQGPPSYGFVTRVYKRNLRPIVMIIAILTAIWALFSAIGNFRSGGYARNTLPKFATFLFALGAIHAGVCGIDFFGIFAAFTQRLPLVRVYAYLSILSGLGIVGAGALRVAVHFSLKNDIITQCTSLSENRTSFVYPFGFFGPVYRDFINHDEAVSWCNGVWNRDSTSEIISLLFGLVVAGLFTSLAFAYYRQVADPSSVVNVTRTPQNPNFNAPFHYNPAYDASVPNLGYGYNAPYSGPTQSQPFAPPPGPPPAKSNEYGADGTVSYNRGVTDHDDPFADFEDTSKKPTGHN